MSELSCFLEVTDLRTHKKILPDITIIVIVSTFLILCNFPLFTFLFNPNCYEAQQVKVEKEGYDGLFAILPKITVTYEYDGISYEGDILDYNAILFHDDNEVCEIYRNTTSSSDFIYIHNFWKSYINILFLLIIIICICRTLNNIRRNYPLCKKKKKIK